MKTGLEKEIKNQLNQRMIQTSENAWQKMNQMLDDGFSEKPDNKKRNYWLFFSIAASVVLVIGLFFFLNHNRKGETEFETPKFVSINKVEKNEVQKTQNKENKPNQIVISNKRYVKDVQHLIEVRPETEKPKIAEIKIPKKTTESALPFNKEIEIPSINIQKTQIAFQTDSIKIPKKKADFVDPEMLLYSIEHNQSVHQSEFNSKLVLIDFNKQK